MSVAHWRSTGTSHTRTWAENQKTVSRAELPSTPVEGTVSLNSWSRDFSHRGVFSLCHHRAFGCTVVRGAVLHLLSLVRILPQHAASLPPSCASSLLWAPQAVDPKFLSYGGWAWGRHSGMYLSGWLQVWKCMGDHPGHSRRSPGNTQNLR